MSLRGSYSEVESPNPGPEVQVIRWLGGGSRRGAHNGIETAHSTGHTNWKQSGKIGAAYNNWPFV